MATTSHSTLVNFIFELANKLRSPYKPAQYRKVMLPLIVLRRLDLVLEPTEAAVLAKHVAQANSQQNFGYVFRKMFEGFFVERLEGNEDIFTRVFGDAEMRRAAEQYLSGEGYRRILERVATLAKATPDVELPLG